MPAYTTHTLFSHMALLALQEDRHPLASVAARHGAMFRVAGIAGADIQCMPYHTCSACDAPYRHPQKSKMCLVCGKEALEKFSFITADGRRLTREDVERDYYRNTHLVLGRRVAAGYGVDPKLPAGPAEQPFPDQVVRHLANMFRDAKKVAGNRRDNFLAFTLGWFSHVVSDALFKGVYPHAARVRFFGHQYNMAMLPAVEALTMTDIACDFGVHWPSWHNELLRDETDGGALRHLVLGNPKEAYDGSHWKDEFGPSDPRIGWVMDAVRPLNRTWFHRMYLTPDYSAPSPRLDKRKLSERAAWTFERLNLGQVRAYAISSGWYNTFIKGVEIYVRVASDAARRAEFQETTESGALPPISWSLWRSIVVPATQRKAQGDWGSRLQIAPEAVGVLEQLRGKTAKFVLPTPATDYQQQIGDALQRAWSIQPDTSAETTVMIGPPAYNASARPLLCREDMLRLKYDTGVAGLVKWSRDSRVLHIVGLSDFGDSKLIAWLSGNAG